jgi:hypothetical protein
MSPEDRDAFVQGLITNHPEARHHHRVLVELMQGQPPAAQAEIWEHAAHEYAPIPDLAADARFRLASAWKGAGESLKAYLAFVDLAKELPDCGPYAHDAMVQAEQMLREAGKDGEVAPLYESVWKRLSAPNDLAAFEESSFNRIGGRYAAALDAAHDRDRAREVRRTIDEARARLKGPP